MFLYRFICICLVKFCSLNKQQIGKRFYIYVGIEFDMEFLQFGVNLSRLVLIVEIDLFGIDVVKALERLDDKVDDDGR